MTTRSTHDSSKIRNSKRKRRRETSPLLLLGYVTFVIVLYMLRCLFPPGEAEAQAKPRGELLIADRATVEPPWTSSPRFASSVGSAELLAWDTGTSSASSTSSSQSDCGSPGQVEQVSSTPLCRGCGSHTLDPRCSASSFSTSLIIGDSKLRLRHISPVSMSASRTRCLRSTFSLCSGTMRPLLYFSRFLPAQMAALTNP